MSQIGDEKGDVSPSPRGKSQEPRVKGERIKKQNLMALNLLKLGMGTCSYSRTCTVPTLLILDDFTSRHQGINMSYHHAASSLNPSDPI